MSIESFWTEFAMAERCPEKEILPCFLYELTRHVAAHPELCIDTPPRGVPANRFSVSIGTEFQKLPYLLLNREQRKAVAKHFHSVYDREYSELIDPNRSDAEIIKDVEQYLAAGRHRSKKRGRGSLHAKLRTNLKAIGAYRILEKYGWNHLPNIPGVDLYTNQSEWIKARKRAEALAKYYLIIWISLCGTRQK
jgi:hypothetical protein